MSYGQGVAIIVLLLILIIDVERIGKDGKK
jgi:hypothetical protein